MKSILTGLFLFLCTLINAQLSLETFEDEYTLLTNPQMLTFGVWDDPNLYIPLEFDFLLFNQTINSLYSISGYHNELHTNISEDSTINILVPLFADLIDPGITSGTSEATISYITDGNEPNRICKIQWDNCAFYNEGDEFSTYYDRANFQIWLYETSNVIEYRYGEINMSNMNINLDTQGAYIGMINNLHLENALNEVIEAEWHLSGYAIYPELTGGIETINDVYTTTLLSDIPSNGTVYRFEQEEDFTAIIEMNTLSSFQLLSTIIENEITIKSNSSASFNIYSMTGKLVSSGELESGKTNISSLELSPGFYFLKINNGSEKKTFKLVKK